MSVLSGARVLITGGSGSYGNALTQHLLSLRCGPETICIYSRDEVKQSEMRARFHDDHRLRFLLGDVRDRQRLSTAFRGVNIVIHAAAMKRVESCSYNVQEAVATNVIGSLNVAQVAMEQGASRVLALSSDKACAPTTTYGVTKACLEEIFTQSNALAPGYGTRLACVRYGNVAGSRGSVIPIWREAIANGLPIPMVAPNHTRFWFTLPEAVEFSLWALEVMDGGELFVPKLPSFRLVDLAAAMSNTSVAFVEWKRIPERPFEKAHESMVSEDEAPHFRAWEGRYVRFLPGREMGDKLPEGFFYRSDRNEEWLSVEDLRRMVE